MKQSVEARSFVGEEQAVRSVLTRDGAESFNRARTGRKQRKLESDRLLKSKMQMGQQTAAARAVSGCKESGGE
ncbi:MAG: hypothetical protein DMG64_18550 [Acidobacteria bacterium]|nr:MAG: hypothetical protein DMG63_18215 [Acidobacteriota bacterium]PYX99811.1 MAG: hypothetical protein DMG64_18550 [Acidobacteriota bacterium]PYY22644.1 MAG: hypothetical protein DMG62_12335 [Acidobacteriota bacterium]